MKRIAAIVVFVLELVTTTPAAPVFTETGGVVVFDAEDFSNAVARSAHSWNFSNAIPGASGATYMESVPDNGANIQTVVATTSPELQFSVDFAVTGQHYVWLRGYATNLSNDSVHVGLDGVASTATNVTFVDSYNAWVWTNKNAAGNSPTITVGTTGLHTVNVWMREDGFRLDRVLLTTNANFSPTPGNVFHLPSSTDPNLASTMRSNLTIYSGNHSSGDGNPGDQLQTGSTVFYRNATNTAWSSTNMLFLLQGPSPLDATSTNKYYKATLPAFNPGDTIQYYLKIPYSDHLPTFVYGNDNLSATTELEKVAQSDPFGFALDWPLPPSGGYLAFTNAATGAEARVYTNSGHIALGNIVAFAPASIHASGESLNLGRVLSATPLSNGFELVQQLAATSIVAQLTFPADGVLRYEVINWGGLAVDATVVTAASDLSEHFFGFGEKFNNFDQAGKKIRILTADPPGTKGDQSYKVAPWFISTRGYGFHLDSSAESWFDMRSDRYVISNMVGQLKYNIVAGPQLTDALSRYTALTGRPALPPPWVFAPWISSDIWRTGGEVRYVVTKMRERGIPGSVFVFDSPWETAYNDFTWNTNQFSVAGTYEGTNWNGFATVSDLMTFFRTNGWKVICWMTPFINNAGTTGEVPGQQVLANNYAEAAASNYFVRASAGGPPLAVSWWKGTGSPVDFTNPNAKHWLQNQLSNLVAQSGGVIGGFKTDDGESGNPPYSYIPKTAVYFDGRTGVEMANGFATEYHRTIWEVLGTNGVLFARSGFTGSQAYSGCWAGDNEPNFGTDNGLPSVIVAGQSAAMSGYAIWGHDICGYQDSNWSSTPANLFMRWAQFGALSPIMQMHRQVSLDRIYPWSFGDEALTNYQACARLHTALFPYIYTYAAQAAATGLPIIRPLVLLNPADTNTYGINHTYYFGDELLVAPIITNNATSRNVYLPAGNWFDWFTQHRYSGGTTIVWTNSNPAQFPLFAREGAIIPLISSNTTTLVTVPTALEFVVYPTTNSSFTVYDGTILSVQSNGTLITATLTTAPRPVTLRFIGNAAGVERDGIRLASFTNLNGFVQVTFAHTGGTTQLRLGPDSNANGIPDSWEDTWGLTCATCDADGDGFSNLQEYLAGTNPFNPANFLRADVLLPGGVSFPSVTGLLYRVESSDDLVANIWTTLSNNIPGTGNPIPIFDPGATNTWQRFYRVRLLP